MESKIDKGTASDFQGKSTIEEESTVNVMKTKRGRSPNKLSSEAPLRELKAYVNNEMKKVWEALESLTKELSKPSKSKKDKDTGPVTKVATSNPVQPLATNLLSTVATSNRFEDLTATQLALNSINKKQQKQPKPPAKMRIKLRLKHLKRKYLNLSTKYKLEKALSRICL